MINEHYETLGFRVALAGEEVFLCTNLFTKSNE
jgi:hypothetical protein